MELTPNSTQTALVKSVRKMKWISIQPLNDFISRAYAIGCRKTPRTSVMDIGVDIAQNFVADSVEDRLDPTMTAKPVKTQMRVELRKNHGENGPYRSRKGLFVQVHRRERPRKRLMESRNRKSNWEERSDKFLPRNSASSCQLSGNELHGVERIIKLGIEKEGNA